MPLPRVARETCITSCGFACGHGEQWNGDFTLSWVGIIGGIISSHLPPSRRDRARLRTKWGTVSPVMHIWWVAAGDTRKLLIEMMKHSHYVSSTSSMKYRCNSRLAFRGIALFSSAKSFFSCQIFPREASKGHIFWNNVMRPPIVLRVHPNFIHSADVLPRRRLTGVFNYIQVPQS